MPGPTKRGGGGPLKVLWWQGATLLNPHFAIGTKDQIIPAGAQRMMSQRAGAKITEYDAGHLGLMSHPGTVTNVIKQAARS